jgi:hypothetical protein
MNEGEGILLDWLPVLPEAVPVLERRWTPGGRRKGSLPLFRGRIVLSLVCPFALIGSIGGIPAKMKKVMRVVAIITF